MAGTKAMKMSTVYYRRKVINAKTISWDNNNVTLVYNSSEKKYANTATSYLTIKDGDTDMSSTAPISLTSNNVVATWHRGASSGVIGQGTTAYGNGKLYVTISQVSAEGGTISASSAVTPGMSSVINVIRVTNRYTFELVCNPTQITYNMTTGVKSAEVFTVNLYVNKSNGGREKATFAAYGALNWRYVGTTTWTKYSNQGTLEATITPDFSKNGIEVQFVDANGVVGDTKTLSILKVSNGGDSYAVISGSTSISLMLESLDHGAPIGDVINTIALTKNGVALGSGVSYNVPTSSDGDKATVDDSFPTASNYEYYGWMFNYSLSEGRLTSTLVKVLEGSPTSVQVPIDIYYKDGSVEIRRQAFISYSVIMKGPAGRSYKPNVAVIWNERDTYVWNDAQRDFVYYPFTDDNGETYYYLYGVKTYNPKGGLKNVRPSNKDGDDYWELVSMASTLITNCIFGTNAIMGGFTFTKEMMTSRSLDKNGESNIIIDGNSGTFKGNNFVGKNCNISGVINATSGTFENVEINNSCQIIQKDGEGWFLVRSNAQANRPESWWLGYSGKLTGQFTMETSYDDGSNHPLAAKLSARTPNIQNGSPSGSPLLELYANISQPLASFSHSGGMLVQICNKLGEGIRFTQQGSTTHLAFCGNGHGGLNGVIQGYKLNTVSSGVIPIANGNTVYCSGNSTSLYLPKLSDCKAVLGTTGAFALDLCIIGASGASGFRVCGSGDSAQTDCKLVGNDFQVWYATMSAGDVLRLKLIFNGSSFLAFVVSHFN